MKNSHSCPKTLPWWSSFHPMHINENIYFGFPLKVLPNATELLGQKVIFMRFEVKFDFHPFSSRSELTFFCELQFQIPISEKALRVIEELQRALSSYETTIATSAEAGIDMETKDFEYKWTYVQSIFFTSTIITTVGRTPNLWFANNHVWLARSPKVT